MPKLTVLVLSLAAIGAFAADNVAAIAVPMREPIGTNVFATDNDAISIPRLLSYQGRLTDTLDISVPDGQYSVAFRFYSQPSGGSAFWNETQNVTTKGGLFSILLGSVTPIGSLPDAGAAYLTMAVAGGAELAPRLRLASSAYAYLAERAANADLLQGRDTTAFVRTDQADAITGAMIVNGTITRADVAASFKAPLSDTADYARAAPAVDSARVAGSAHRLQGKDTTGFVRTGEVDAITSAMIVNGTIVRADVAAGFKAPGADTADYARNATIARPLTPPVSSGEIADGAVTNAKILDGAVTTGKLAEGSVTSIKIADGTIAEVDLAASAVTTTRMADNAVTSGKIAAGAVTTVKVADANVTSGKLADGAVTSTKLGEGAVLTGKIADNAINTAKIADQAVTGAKIQNYTIQTHHLSPGTLVPNADSVRGITASTTPQPNQLYPLDGNMAIRFGTPSTDTSDQLAYLAVKGVEKTIEAVANHTFGISGGTILNGGTGVQGHYFASASTGIGIEGVGRAGTGVRGTTTGSNQAGVRGEGGSSSYGVHGVTSSSSHAGVYGEGSTGGVYGYSTSTSNGSYGVWGRATGGSGSTRGVWGSTSSSSGDGVRGEGPARGVMGWATNSSGNREGGYFEIGGGKWARVATYFNGSYYNVYGNSYFACELPTEDGPAITYATLASAPLIEDMDAGQLRGGSARVELSPRFLACTKATDAHPYRVFVQMNGDCRGVYVVVHSDHFEVRELDGGTSDAPFTYRVLGYAAGSEYGRFQLAPGRQRNGLD